MSIFTRGTELRRFRQGTLPKIALAVLLVIPLIYGALYLWAFWAPTDHMDRLPVAVVNLDEAAEKPDGTELTAGADVLEELERGGDLDWRRLDAERAARAVADGDVYFAVTIPRDFSSTLAGLQDDPKAGEIEVVYNDNNSFLAATLGKQAMVQLRDAVAETTTRAAAEQVLVGVERLSDGTRDAADAAGALETGTAAVAAGSDRLSAGLGELASGTSQLLAGTPELVDGSRRLAGGLGQLNAGLGTLSGGADRLAAGSAQLSEGAGALSSGADSLAGATTALSDGAAALAQGTGALSDGATGLAGGSAQLSTAAAQIAQLAAANPEMTLAQLDAGLRAQGSSLQGLAEGAAALDGGVQEVVAGAASLSGSADQLAGGASQVQQGSADLAANLAVLSGRAGELSGGAAQVSAGASALYEKSGEAADGGNRLAAGAGQAAAGAARLDAGAQEASEKSGELAAGAAQLDRGSAAFAGELAAGAAEAPTFAEGQTLRIAETMAAPVELAESTENEVQGFGEGFAPFFIALASFVGALITWLILRPLPRRPLASNVSGLRSVLAGFWPAALIAIGQVVVMMSVLVFGIGMRPAHWLGMSLFMLLTTLAFLALQQMFIALLGTATGRVVSLVLLMLMLSSSGGTYPVETTPAFFQILHPFMPASYVVDGLRQLIGGGIDGRFWLSLAMMLAVLFGSLAISAVSARRQKVWTIKRLHPELAI